MVEKTDRSEDANGPRSADGRRFEVFVREEESDPLRHVGTVAAPTPDVAHEEASKLFAWYARDVWVCPAAEVSRYSAASLADDGSAEAESSADTDEPRVYEETEGTPTASAGGGSAADTAGAADVDAADTADADDPEGSR